MRIVNRLLAGLVALGLITAGLLAAVEVVAGAARGRPLVVPWDDWYADARGHAWSTREARTLLLVLLAAGVALFVLQLVRRGPQSVPRSAPDGAPKATVEINTRSLQRALARRVSGIDGVEWASVSISHRRVSVSVRTARREPDGLEASVRRVVEERLRSLGVARPTDVVVGLRRNRAAERAAEAAVSRGTRAVFHP